MKRAAVIAGVDEVGRGSLAGAVVAAAVVLDAGRAIAGLRDSKRLTPRRRELLDLEIRTHALGWALGRAEVEEIDALNILHATMLAMRRAVSALAGELGDGADSSSRWTLGRVLVDGNRCPELPCPAEAIVQGDNKVDAIMAASIVAKVARDREMEALDALYPGYGFARHKGYGTRAHLDALRTLGPLPVHRKSFAPVRIVQGELPF